MPDAPSYRVTCQLTYVGGGGSTFHARTIASKDNRSAAAFALDVDLCPHRTTAKGPHLHKLQLYKPHENRWSTLEENTAKPDPN